MVRLIGNIKAEDDYTHELGPEPNFNESVYFNFFDPSLNRGGFVRMGNRANEGYAEMTSIVWNPDGSALFMYAKPEINHNDGWNAGGLSVEIVKPAEQVITRYKGKALYLKNPIDMRDPSRAFKENPRENLVIELTHDAVGPMYGHVGEEGDGNDFARAHTEQHMRVSGFLQLGEMPRESFQGWGLRDHSWGPRYWQSAPSYRWITGNFGDDLGMVITTNGEGVGGGLFQMGDNIERMESAVLDTQYSENGSHKSLSVDIKMQNGDSHKLTGEVMGYIPLRSRRAGANTSIGEGMTAYTLDDDRTGYGLSEYLNNNNE